MRTLIVAMTLSLGLPAQVLAASPDPVTVAPVAESPSPPPAAAPAPEWPAEAPVTPVTPGLGSSAAPAQPEPPLDPWTGRPAATATQPRPPRLVEVTTGYGWQIVLADVAGLVAVGVVGAAGGGGGGSVLPYFLASPIVHAAHGNAGKALGSLGLHLGLPIVGAMVGLGAGGNNCNGDSCEIGAIVVGVLGGMVAATVVDAAWLAHTTVQVDASQVALAPAVTVARSGGATFGIAATF